jgi:hypothetical protein
MVRRLCLHRLHQPSQDDPLHLPPSLFYADFHWLRCASLNPRFLGHRRTFRSDLSNGFPILSRSLRKGGAPGPRTAGEYRRPFDKLRAGSSARKERGLQDDSAYLGIWVLGAIN